MSTTDDTEALAEKVKETRARYHALAARNVYHLTEAERALALVEYRQAQAEYWKAMDALVHGVAPSTEAPPLPEAFGMPELRRIVNIKG